MVKSLNTLCKAPANGSWVFEERGKEDVRSKQCPWHFLIEVMADHSEIFQIFHLRRSAQCSEEYTLTNAEKILGNWTRSLTI
jgi:hypothetical protein